MMERNYLGFFSKRQKETKFIFKRKWGENQHLNDVGSIENPGVPGGKRQGAKATLCRYSAPSIGLSALAPTRRC